MELKTKPKIQSNHFPAPAAADPATPVHKNPTLDYLWKLGETATGSQRRAELMREIMHDGSTILELEQMVDRVLAEHERAIQ